MRFSCNYAIFGHFAAKNITNFSYGAPGTTGPLATLQPEKTTFLNAPTVKP